MRFFDRFRRKPPPGAAVIWPATPANTGRCVIVDTNCRDCSWSTERDYRGRMIRRTLIGPCALHGGDPEPDADLAACLDGIRDQPDPDALAGIAAWMAADEAERFLEHLDQEDR